MTAELPFNGVEMHGELPAELPKSEAKPKAERIVFGERVHAFLLTGMPYDRDLRINIDPDGDGKYTGPGEGSFATGDAVELDDKRLAITLGTERGVGMADVRLTWSTAEQLVGDLRHTYTALLDAEWQDRACQACWENTYGKLFENVGFDRSWTYRWAVRLADSDQVKGSIVNVVERLEYRVAYE